MRHRECPSGERYRSERPAASFCQPRPGRWGRFFALRRKVGRSRSVEFRGFLPPVVHLSRDPARRFVVDERDRVQRQSRRPPHAPPCSPIRVVLYSRVAREATRKWMSRREGTMMTPSRRYSALFTLCLAVVLVGGMSTMHAAAQKKPGVDVCSTCSGPDRGETESGTEGGTSGGDGSGSKRGSGGTGGEVVIPRIPIPTLSWPPPPPPTWTPPQWTPPSWSRPSVPSWTPEVTPSPPQRLESRQLRSEQPGATTVEDTVAPAGPTTPGVEAGRSRASDDSAPPAPPPASEVGSVPLAPPAPSESPAPSPLPVPSTADVESKAVVTDFQAWLLFAAALAGTFLMVRVVRAHRRYTSRRDLVTRFETRLAATPVVVDMPEDPLPTRSVHLELRISNQEES